MAFFDKWFGKDARLNAKARAAELRGELAKAAELYGAAGQPAEAGRVMLLRGDGETDARVRLQHFTQASKLTVEGTEANRSARLKRAELLLALAGDTAVSAVARHEVSEAARDLEAIGEPLKAAEAFARSGDKDGEARALQAAGDVERLEFLLSSEQFKERSVRTREGKAKDIDAMIESGRRRDALGALEELLRGAPDDAPLRERANGLRARRVLAPIVAVEVPIDGAPQRLVLVTGDEVVIGRDEQSAITVPSNAVSRQHLRLFRQDGAVFVRDLESRNGTQLRGINLAGAIALADGLELKLGKEVPLRILPSARLHGAIEIAVAGETFLAWLGPTRTPIPGVALAPGSDGWLELVLDGARGFVGDVELAPRTTLLVGDAIATTRGAAPLLRILST